MEKVERGKVKSEMLIPRSRCLFKAIKGLAQTTGMIRNMSIYIATGLTHINSLSKITM